MQLISLACKTDSGLGDRARLGLIVLQTDQTLEHEFRQLLAVPGVAWYHSRIANAMEVTPQTLQQMAADLPAAAAMLPTAFEFDAIAYGCTSGATVIGEQAVAEAIQTHHPKVPVTNPLTACKAAFKAMGLQRIAFLTPYSPQVTGLMREQLQASGFDVVCTGSFEQTDDFVVGRISSQSILEAMQQLVSQVECDGVFVSCTSLHAMAWHLLRLANYQDSLPDRGQLFTHSLATI